MTTFTHQICTWRLRIHTSSSYSMPSTPDNHSSDVLQAAWDCSSNYSSERTHKELVTAFNKAFNGLESYDCHWLATWCYWGASPGSKLCCDSGYWLWKNNAICNAVAGRSNKEKNGNSDLSTKWSGGGPGEYHSNVFYEDSLKKACRFKNIGLTATAVNSNVWNDVLQEVRVLQLAKIFWVIAVKEWVWSLV